jgi:DNA-binding transcriptional LysR family regulator
MMGRVAVMVSRSMDEKEIRDGSLLEIFVEIPHSFYLWLAIKKGHTMSPRARTFLAHLK